MVHMASGVVAFELVHDDKNIFNLGGIKRKKTRLESSIEGGYLYRRL